MAIKTYYLLKRYTDTSEKNLPFYIENLTSNSGTATLNAQYSDATNVECSTDNETWTTATLSGTSYQIPVAANGKVYIRANATKWNSSNSATIFTFNYDYNVGGNIMSLFYGSIFTGTETAFPDATKQYVIAAFSKNQVNLKSAEKLALPATTLANSCYDGMFRDCSSLTAAPALPATALAKNCYNYMFYRCTSLTSAPALPATTLANSCYGGMFYGCTSLTAAPALPATTLADYCYQSMFQSCTSLTTAPTLPATTLVIGCYSSMFYGCTSLTTAPTLPATGLANSSYTNMFNGCTSLGSVTVGATSWNTSYANTWLNNVSPIGTFTKPSATNIPTGTSGIPSGWTVVNV